MARPQRFELRIVLACAVACAVSEAACSFVTNYDGLQDGIEVFEASSPDGSRANDGAAPALDDGSPSTSDASPSNEAGPSGCTPGVFYCGGDGVKGDAGTLYTCTSGNSGTVRGVCSAGCVTHAGGDACEGSGGCVKGAFYCGGDKVTGDPKSRYVCDGGKSGTLVETCAIACTVVPNSDDQCQN